MKILQITSLKKLMICLMEYLKIYWTTIFLQMVIKVSFDRHNYNINIYKFLVFSKKPTLSILESSVLSREKSIAKTFTSSNITYILLGSKLFYLSLNNSLELVQLSQSLGDASEVVISKVRHLFLFIIILMCINNPISKYN